MGVSDAEKILQQQMKILLEQSEERKKWTNSSEDIMNLSIGMSHIARAIIECDRFKLKMASYGARKEKR